MNDTKVSSASATIGPHGDLLLAKGSKMSMRLWQNEEPQLKEPHRSDYETLGYVISGRAELTVEGHTVPLEPGDSYLVPAGAEHTYRIIVDFTAVECTAPAAV